MDVRLQRALDAVDAFTSEHPEYGRRGVEQPSQGATNRVVFARRGDELVVFKVFEDLERKERECFAYRHWGGTGLVPRLLRDAGPHMIVISHVPGVFPDALRASHGEAARLKAWRHVGEALGGLARVPLSENDRADFEKRFYERGPLESYLGRLLELARLIHARDPGYGGAFWAASIEFMESQLAPLLVQPRVLYHQDPGNLYATPERFSGFFDLEMCRVGCAAMQLASAIGMVASDEGTWRACREGWERATLGALSTAELETVATGHHFLTWRVISRYMSYDGTPGTGFAWSEPADPAWARDTIASVQRVLQIPQE